MSERQTLSLEKLVAVIETEFAKSLGRSVAQYMPRIRLRTRTGEPNWHADIGGDTGLIVVGAFFESFDRVRAVYDLDVDARQQLIVQSRNQPCIKVSRVDRDPW
jgi:hypothetical protein